MMTDNNNPSCSSALYPDVGAAETQDAIYDTGSHLGPTALPAGHNDPERQPLAPTGASVPTGTAHPVQAQHYQTQLYPGQVYQAQPYQGQQFQSQPFQSQLYQGQLYQEQLSNDYYVAPSYRPEPPLAPRQRPRRYQPRRGWLEATLKLAVFHVLNALLGIVAFVAVVTGVHIAFALIPLCCLGIIVFRGVLVVVRWLAEMDVKLCDFPEEDPPEGLANERLSPDLQRFSPQLVLATLYFATVKFALGLASLATLSIFALLPLLLDAAFNGQEFGVDIEGYMRQRVGLDRNPAVFWLVWGCLCLVAVVLLHFVAWLSRAATRFICCERTERDYDDAIPITQYPGAATRVYGSTGLYGGH